MRSLCLCASACPVCVPAPPGVFLPERFSTETYWTRTCNFRPFSPGIGYSERCAARKRSAGMESMLESSPYLDVQAESNESVNRQLQNLVKNVHAHFAQDVVPPSAAAAG